MERWAGKVAVVTGASAGIGLETAKALVRHGMIVVGIARRVEKMENCMKEVDGPGKFYAKGCDITNENEVTQVFDWIENNFKTVHILINNAGLCKKADIHDMATEDMLRTINVNIVGLLRTRKAINLMKKNNHEAHIVNVNSVSGQKVDNRPGLNVYPATKFALRALSEVLIYETKDDKIRVTNLSPRFIKTELFSVAGVCPTIFDNQPFLKPEDVTNSIIYVLSTPPYVQITELTIKPMVHLQ